MSLYDDIDTDRVPGWASGSMKLLQSQMKFKKAQMTQPKRDLNRRATLAPVINLKRGKEDEPPAAVSAQQLPSIFPISSGGSRGNSGTQFISLGPDFNVRNEYDPFRPNDYDKIVRNMRRKKDSDRDRDRERDRDRREREREHRRRQSDDEEEEEHRKRSAASKAAIAPPSSLLEPDDTPSVSVVGSMDPPVGGGSIAAKIMAKYGYKEGQGLGKSEQGISRALEVEKTSKRGGRIIHEKDMPPPPVPLFAQPMQIPPLMAPLGPIKPEPSLTDIMKSPTKVVLLRNMVGGGQVDDDLEAEVKEECSTKYGDVMRVIIYEVPSAPDEEAVRIFVEFKRMEHAIKAVVDLNGRYFGGRSVKAGFYDYEKYSNYKLDDY